MSRVRNQDGALGRTAYGAAVGRLAVSRASGVQLAGVRPLDGVRLVTGVSRAHDREASDGTSKFLGVSYIKVKLSDKLSARAQFGLVLARPNILRTGRV